MMLSVALMTVALGQAQAPQELEFLWQRRSAADRQATAVKVVALLWAAGTASTVSEGRADLRGAMWLADFDASGSPVRVQHDGDSDEWLLNRRDLAPILPLTISHEDASRELLALRDRFVALGLLDGPNFNDCAPEVTETRMGGGGAGVLREEQVVELTARCRATHAGVPILNLGFQVRFRAGGLSSIRFSRARAIEKTSAGAVARPEPLGPSEVAREWPRLLLKENNVVYLAEEKPGSGGSVAQLVQLIAGAERFSGGVSRTRILVRRSGATMWREPNLGEQANQSSNSR